MEREEAKRICMEWVDEQIAVHGKDLIFLVSPKRGKNTWTLKEYRDAIINDAPMEGTNTSPIDDFIKYRKYINELNKEKNVNNLQNKAS